MICNKDTAKKTAKLLLEINAIKLQPKDPFKWASGWKSPIYCDNRIVLSFPDMRNFITDSFVESIKKNYPETEVIAGVATGAIAVGALVAQALGLPFVYVRPQPKEYGKKNQVEGRLLPKQKVLVIEDLISTGMSSLNAVAVLQEADADVLAMYAIFTYDFDKSKEAFQQENIILYTLSDYHQLLIEAVDSGFITDTDKQLLQQWRENPALWK